MYYVVKYSGPFGFIKPWTAVRDGETYSQQFLTPSIVEGIEKKLFPELLAKSEEEKFIFQGVQKIIRHKLTYKQLDVQQEQTRAKEFKKETSQNGIVKVKSNSIIKRGVMINPILQFAFENYSDAEVAIKQHICLSRNEDILIPEVKIEEISFEEFNLFEGFELRFEENEKSFLVGFNRYNKSKPMYGWLDVVGNPIRNNS